MRLSENELKVLEQVAGGNNSIISIAKILNRNRSQIYRIAQRLKERGILDLERGALTPKEATHISLLLQALARYPSIIMPLSDCGIEVFTAILEPKSVGEITLETGFRQGAIYRKLGIAKNMSFINSRNKKYVFNERIWPTVKELLREIKKYEEARDKRAPPGSIIYFKNEKEIVFSCEEERDATLTAFSAFKNFGIRILTPYRYYYLPKKILSKREVLMHALYVAEKEKEIRNKIYIALFYRRHRKGMKEVQHDIIKKINKVLNGQKIKGYPSLAEIKEKAEIYDIRI